jgi:hypothetical protein
VVADGRCATSPVKPEPANGSDTRPAGGLIASMRGCKALTGFDALPVYLNGITSGGG